jgi:hypothetical protein
MSRSDSKAGKKRPRVTTQPEPGDIADDSRQAPVDNNISGRVKFDDRGNAIWEWAMATGKQAVGGTTARFKKLVDAPLALADEPSNAEIRPSPVRGYSPYDSGLLVKHADGAKPKKTDLRRLSEWMKLRQQFKNNKSD